MPLIRAKVDIKDHRFDIPEMGEDSITGFCAGEEIKPDTKTAIVYVAGNQNVLNTIISKGGVPKTDVSAQCETLHLKEAKDKADKKDKDKEPKKDKVK